MFKTIKVLDTNYYFNTENLRLLKNSKKHLKDELKQEANYSNKKLYKLVFNIANTCNLCCMYCYASCGNYGRNNNLMSKEQADIIIKELHNKYTDVQTVYFFGGEPTINFQLIKYVVEKLNKYYNIKDYRIVTNATLINAEMVDFFCNNNFKIYISIDGPEKINNHLRGNYYLKLMNTIQNFKNKKYDQKLELICTYTKYHQDNISFDDLIGFFENLGIKYSISDVITNDKRLKIIKTQKEAIEQEKKYIDLSFDRILNNSLNVGISHYLRNVIDALVIKNSSKYFCKELCDNYSNVYDYNGDIYPCIRLIGTHLKSDPVIEKYNIKSNEKCKNCWAKNICRDCVADIILGNNRAPYEKKFVIKNLFINMHFLGVLN